MLMAVLTSLHRSIDMMIPSPSFDESIDISHSSVNPHLLFLEYCQISLSSQQSHAQKRGQCNNETASHDRSGVDHTAIRC